jgi:hypothetical protein
MTVFTFGSGFDTDWVELRSDVPRNVKFENSIEKVRFQNNIKKNAKEFPLIAILRPIKIRIFECSSREDEKCLAYKAKVIKVLKGKYNKSYITFVNNSSFMYLYSAEEGSERRKLLYLVAESFIKSKQDESMLPQSAVTLNNPVGLGHIRMED